MLQAADRAHFSRHGWVWLRQYLSEQETQQLADWTTEIEAWPEVPGKWMRYYERPRETPGEKLLARIENFFPYHRQVADLFRGERFLDLLEECCDEPVILFKDKINFKKPGGAGFAPHQDAPAYVDFGIEHHLTVMVPVDPFTRENGCLEMALGASARRFLPQHPDGTLRPEVCESLKTEALLAGPGDVILFDAWVPHWSGPNLSPAPRRSYYLTFNPASAGDHRLDYYRRKRECFPPEYERRAGVDYAIIGKQFNLGNPFD